MKNVILSLAFLLSFSALWGQTLYYVNQSAAGANTGQSWQNAFADLQTALQTAQAGDEVWVAKGTYLPTQDNNRNISFEPASGVKLYGGFAGHESLLDQRDWETNLTVLSGDIGIAEDSMDNSLNVVYLSEPDSNTVINGFWIRHGHANDATSSVPLSRFRSGGGMYIMGQSSDAYPEIRNCVFEYNSSISFGAAVLVNGTNDGSVSPWFMQCRFEKNRTLGSGGGIAQFGGSLVERGIEFQSCSFIQNIANSFGGGIYYSEGPGVAHLQVEDCLFELNTGKKSGGGLYLILGRAEGAKCTIRGSTFHQNISASGASIFTFPQGFEIVSLLEIDNSVFLDNVFAANPSGPSQKSVIWLENLNDYGSEIIFSNNTLSKNKNWENILFIPSGGGALLKLKNYQFIENQAINQQNTTTNGDILIEGAIFLSNYAKIGLTLPLELAGNKCTIKNFLSAKNFTIEDYFSMIYPKPLTIQNAIFDDKTNSHLGGPIVGKPDSLFVRNTTFLKLYQPVNFFYSTKRTNISHCQIDSAVCNLPLAYNITCGPGNLFNLDPLFRDTANNDYSLLPCSPLLNAGSNAAAAGTITDIAGNPRIQEGTVDIGAYESAGFALAGAPTVAPACEGTSGGSITLQPVNGCEPYTYNWIPNAGTGAELNELPPGAYQYTLTDASGRQIIDTVLVPEAPRPDLSLQATDVMCGNPAGGSLTAVVSSGTGPFSYQWLPASADTSVLKKLPAGAYALTLTDANGCQDSALANIELLGAITLAVDGQPIPCFGQTGWLSATPANGASPFIWQWSGWSGTDSLAQPLTPGSYAVTVTDVYGCSASFAFPEFTQPDSMYIGTGGTPQTQSSPPNGTALVTTISGGTFPFEYAWHTLETTQAITGLEAGTYTVTVSDKNGCTATAEVVVELMVSTQDQVAPALLVYPNPTMNWVRMLLPAGNWHWELTDSGGRILRTGICHGEAVFLDLQEMPEGAYLLKAWNGQLTCTGRVLKH